jgi:hypothetical protein
MLSSEILDSPESSKPAHRIDLKFCINEDILSNKENLGNMIKILSLGIKKAIIKESSEPKNDMDSFIIIIVTHQSIENLVKLK